MMKGIIHIIPFIMAFLDLKGAILLHWRTALDQSLSPEEKVMPDLEFMNNSRLNPIDSANFPRLNNFNLTLV
jgi:hypothetical protein